MSLLIGVIITALMYMGYPLYKFTNKDKSYTKKEIRKTLIINSIVVFIIDTFIGYSIFLEDFQISPLPMFFYYFVNCCVWFRIAAETDEDIETNNKIKAKNNIAKVESIDKSTNVTQNANDLRELKKLVDEGVLTAEEFEEEKKKILNR